MHRLMRCACVLGVLLPPVCASTARASGYVEGGAMNYRLTQGYGSWQGLYAAGVWGVGSGTVWNWELDHNREFGQRASYGVIGLTQTLSPRWYTSLSLGGSNAGDIMPSRRFDASLARKWLGGGWLITSVGASRIEFRDGHKTSALNAGLVAYLPADWVLQGGHDWARSDPGAAFAGRSFVAVTQGRAGRHYLTLRYGWGGEAYLVLGANALNVNYQSRDISLNWRQWVTPDWGFSLYLEDYSNPYYRRTGGRIGVFYAF
ncbi:YaiO family outer membrane beta-barrel protein [Acidihalobacter prosperus]|uniref:YaiO beta-barrel domain-containing protein n=1 Tax=Acidihalobacter prosperus TaxID=160660 RepID=A0A1A6C0M6_9GAMM|nr:YaiO family outer membrane beta-barrel protein [Acidihalobacter prosperus]OBS08110.1 hypothetical protein Thpro_022360 [Acidihalobacter prosperus]